MQRGNVFPIVLDDGVARKRAITIIAHQSFVTFVQLVRLL